MTRLLLYMSSNSASERLKVRINDISLEVTIEIATTVYQLVNKLRQPKHDLILAILHTVTMEEFERIVNIGDMLKDIRTIIILPNRNKNTISTAFKLFPRLIGFADEDYTSIVAVADHILKRQCLKT